MNTSAISPFTRYELNEITGCWLWTGYMNKDGYARLNGENAHRVFYREFIGDIEAGHDIDHLCKRRNCVNPAHLESVPEAENLRRAVKHVEFRGDQVKVCREGHLVVGANVRLIHKRGNEYQTCWLCSSRGGSQRIYARRTAAMLAASGSTPTTPSPAVPSPQGPGEGVSTSSASGVPEAPESDPLTTAA